MALPNMEPLPRIDAAALRSSVLLSSVIGCSIKLQRAGRELVAPCPFHQDRTPSFTVNDDKGFYHCFGCGAHGDVIDWVMHAQGVGFVEAAEILGSGGYVAAPIRQDNGRSSATIPPDLDRSEEAAALWNASAPAAGTVVEAYLSSRAITIPPPSCLRFARLPYRGRGSHPVMVAAVSTLKGEIAGVQRTYLRPDGSGKADVPNAKLSLGRIGGGAIRLSPAAAELIVTGGIEDGLSLMQELGRPVWAVTGEANMASVVLPELVRSVVIGADNDETGRVVARKAGEAFALQGREARIILPTAPHKDFNAQLQGDR